MTYIIIVVSFLTAVLLGRMLIPYILLITFRRRLFDPIDPRKTHKGNIPRLGGVSFAPIQCCLLTLAVLVLYKFDYVDFHYKTPTLIPMFLLLMCGLVLLFMVGIADDLIGVSYKRKFVAQIIAATLLPLSGLWINDLYGVMKITYLSPWLGMPLTVFIVVLIMNAVNLIDGIDGLCSGLIAAGSITLGGLFVYNHALLHAIFAFITAGVLIPFFYYNVFGASRRRHRIFMGDTGSLTLGFSISFMAISYATNNQQIMPFSEGAIVVAFSTVLIPVLDVARVMLWRFRHRKPIFKPDRNHIHHKFLRIGLSHHAAMLLILLMAFLLGVFNIVMVEYISNNVVLLLDVVLWISFHWWFGKMEKKIMAKRKFREEKQKEGIASVQPIQTTQRVELQQ
jgi:UDP-N-acetylmuramyl pentapeptide phosphotransferase/UDP-N-acetylglucosamine-1-phosphate transferase